MSQFPAPNPVSGPVSGPVHYADPDFVPTDRYLDDAIYGRALDALVKACVDVFVQDDQGRVFMGKRCVDPHPDWWYMGGRMVPGESPERTAARVFGRETGLPLPPERFAFLRVVTYTWAIRAQPPAHHGTADVVLIYTAHLTSEEADMLALEPSEYCEGRWFHRHALPSNLHPSLVDTLGLVDTLSLSKSLLI